MSSAEERGRLVYFWSVGNNDGGGKRAVLCPACLGEMQQAVPAEAVRAHYFTDRALVCSSCLILIGPSNDEEMSEL